MNRAYLLSRRRVLGSILVLALFLALGLYLVSRGSSVVSPAQAAGTAPPIAARDEAFVTRTAQAINAKIDGCMIRNGAKRFETPPQGYGYDDPGNTAQLACRREFAEGALIASSAEFGRAEGLSITKGYEACMASTWAAGPDATSEFEVTKTMLRCHRDNG